MMLLLVLPALLAVTGCKKSDDVPEDTGNTVKDPQGNVYQWKEMNDGRIWMVENLRYEVPGSWTYPEENYPENIAYNPKLFGRLYTWDAAVQSCKSLEGDWHLPNFDEWAALAEAYGEWDQEHGKYDSYYNLVANLYDWDGNGSSGFNAVLGGFYDPNIPMFDFLGLSGPYWTALEHGMYNDVAWVFNFSKTTRGITPGHSVEKKRGASCRCIKDVGE